LPKDVIPLILGNTKYRYFCLEKNQSGQVVFAYCPNPLSFNRYDRYVYFLWLTTKEQQAKNTQNYQIYYSKFI
jgi:hypothetical protein